MGSRADVQPLSADMGESRGSVNLWEGRTIELVKLVNTNGERDKILL